MSTPATGQHGNNPSALPIGTRLGEFELRSLLGVGGFGIVYLAFDHALEREVAVKEYMPASLAGRTETMHVSLRSQSDAETFALGLRSFVNEAKLLARFDHPSLLKVLRFWEANGTAYMAMPVMRGRTLKEMRREMTAPPDEAWLREMLVPLLGAIETLHAEGVYHRDIAPDNIQIEPGGRPVLLDFGAARRVISDVTHTITAILKPAYAPIEQYAEANAVKQGPWTDLYALGATLHYMLMGRPPAPATTRAVFDEPTVLSPESCPRCSAAFLRVVDWMLAPRPADRPQSVAALREVLEGRAALPEAYAGTAAFAPAAAPEADWDRTVIRPRTLPPASLVATTVLLPADAARVEPPLVSAPAFEPPATTPLPQTLAPLAPKPKNWLPVAAGAGVLAAAAAAFVLWPRPEPAPVLAAQPAPAPPPAALAVPASAPLPAAAALPTAPAVSESAVATVVVPGTPAPRPAPNQPASRPANAAKPPPPQAVPAATATAPAPAPVTPAPAPAPQRAEAAPPAAAPQPVPTEPPKPEVQAPEARCAGRNPLSYFACMERECLRGQSRAHPDCQKWRAGAAEKQQ